MKSESPKPNVLFITIHDLNDWIGCLGGHPDTRTPHLDALARSGVLFRNAHCPAPVCNPSRTAFLSGRQPFRTGIYHNKDDWSSSPELEANPGHIFQHFKAHGYRTALEEGTVYHTRPSDLDSCVDETRESFGQHMFDLVSADYPAPFADLSGIHNFAAHWGPLDEEQSAKLSDPKVARWAGEQLGAEHDQPFLLGVGFSRPHTPLSVPREYYDRFDINKITLPEVPGEALEQLPPLGRHMAMAGFQDMEGGRFRQIIERGHWRDYVHGYLACISFVDDQVGKVLKALDEGPNRENTIVVLMSDHGWGLGEHYHFEKWALWEDVTHVPLMMRIPGMAQAGAETETPVSLIDLFPTLLDLCDLPQPNHALDGRSLLPLLNDPAGNNWQEPVITTYGVGNYALRDRRWRYIRYSDGSEELYDHSTDPHEYQNLASHPGYGSIIGQLKKHLPESQAPAPTCHHVAPVTLTPDHPMRYFWSVATGFAGHPLSITVDLGSEPTEGVLLSHGGQFSGYALYIQNSRLHFAVMDVPEPLHWQKLDPIRTMVSTPDPLPLSSRKLRVEVNRDGAVRLLADGALIGSGQVKLLTLHPTGEMHMGKAPGQYVPVGDYDPEFEYTGDIKQILVEIP